MFRGISNRPKRALTAMCAALLCLGAAAVAGAPAQAAGKEVKIPLFRHIDPSLLQSRGAPPRRLRILLEDNLPPFMFRTRAGALTGYAVAVAQAVCRQAHVQCEYIIKPHDQIRAALTSGKADVILASLRPLPENWREMDFTRPYFRALGRFMVRREARITAASHTALAARHIAVVKGTVHEAWLRLAFGARRVHVFRDFAAAAAALKEKKVDALFGDWLQVAFWAQGAMAGGCCRPLPEVFVHRLFAYNDVSMAVRAGREDLRDFLDRQLDRLQEDGELQVLARRFLPLEMRLSQRAENAQAQKRDARKAAGKEQAGGP